MIYVAYMNLRVDTINNLSFRDNSHSLPILILCNLQSPSNTKHFSEKRNNFSILSFHQAEM
jgi:hypothetical protein